MKQNMCVAVGVGIGVVLDALTGEHGMWLASGTLVGIAVGAAIGKS